MSYTRPFAMPPGVVSAIERGASAGKAYGYPNMVVNIVDGRIARMSMFDRDGRQHYVVRSERGKWLEHVDVGG